MNTSISTEEIIARLTKLEAAVFGNKQENANKFPGSKKPITLPELVKDKNLKNGQEKVTFIVGYYEHVLGSESVSPDDIRLGWKQARFNGNYAPILLSRAESAGMVNNYGNKGKYVLTMSGEDFYQNLNR